MAWFRRAQAGGGDNQVEKVRVVVSTTPVGANEVLDSHNGKFRVVERSKTEVPEGVLQRLEDLDGKVTLGPIGRDQIVLAANVQNRQDRGLIGIVPTGTRAITIATDNLTAVGGFVKPGDRVDIVANMDMGAQGFVTKVVLQNVQVLAVNSDLASTPKPADTKAGATPATAASTASSVTLALPLDQIERLMLAETKGKLRLVLRGLGENGVQSVASAKMSDIVPTPAPATAAAPKPAGGSKANHAPKPNAGRRGSGDAPWHAPVLSGNPFSPWGGNVAPAGPSGAALITDPSSRIAASNNSSAKQANNDKVITIIRGDTSTTHTFSPNDH